MSRQSDTRDVAHPSVRKASPSLQKGIRTKSGSQHIGDVLKSRYVASENKKADMHTKRLATVR